MKKTLTLVLLFLAAMQQAWATDRFVNPTVIPNTVPNFYATPTAALYDANNGDRIFLKAGTYNCNITIKKSITLMPDSSGSTVNIVGSGIEITGYSGMKVYLVGLNINGPIVGVDNMPSFLDSQSATINIIDCNVISSNISFETAHNYYLKILRTRISGNVGFCHGDFVASKAVNLYITPQLPFYYTENYIKDTISKNFIVADTITGNLNYCCFNYKLIIANNLLNNLGIFSWNYNKRNTNYVLNNEFISGAKFYISSGDYGSFSSNYLNSGYSNYQFNAAQIGQFYYNFDIENNVFANGGVYFMTGLEGTSSGSLAFSIGPSYSAYTFNNVYFSVGYSVFDYIFNSGSTSYNMRPIWNNNPNNCLFPNIDVPGNFKWMYNGFTIAGSGSSGNYPFANISGTSNIVNAGNPDPKYMDIDMTVNDRGRLGGPYSILNYNPTVNPSNGKAYIYDIELPDVISSPTQPIQIKAKGYHRN